jgi:hypothetical protein
MTDSTYTPEDDKTLKGSDVNYSTVRLATSATNILTAVIMGQYADLYGYYINRRAQVYDTSDLVTELVSVVKLRIHCDSVLIDGSDFTVVIQKDTGNCPSNPIVLGDYDQSKYSGSGGSKVASTFSSGVDPEGWNDITLDPTWVTTNGLTRLIIRSSRDINGNAPAEDPAYERIQLSLNPEPQLIVTHTPLPSEWRAHGGSDEDELVKAEREYQEYASKNLNKFKSSAGLFELPYQAPTKPRKIAGEEWRRLRFKKY